MTTFDTGAVEGLERYCQLRGDTFETPDGLLGALAGGTSNSEYIQGYLHGMALGASLQLDAMTAVVTTHVNP